MSTYKNMILGVLKFGACFLNDQLVHGVFIFTLNNTLWQTDVNLIYLIVKTKKYQFLGKSTHLWQNYPFSENLQFNPPSVATDL